MSDPVLPPLSDETPIDAEFEPAPKRKPKPVKNTGPGWFSFVLLGVVSLGALGLSILSSGVFGGSDDSVALKADIERLKVDQTAASEARSALNADLDRVNTALTSLDSEAETDRERLIDLSEALTIIENDLQDYAASTADLDSQNDRPQAPDRVLARLQALETALSEAGNLETQTGASEIQGDGSFADTSEIEADIAKLRTDVDRLRDELTTLRGDLSDLIEQQDAAAALGASNAKSAEAALALSAIETAARRGQPFQTALRQLENAAPDLAVLDKLAPIAMTGAPTLPDLRESFRPLKRTALKADAESQGATQSVLNTLFGDGIRVRREGEVSAADIIDAADAALITGDLDNALASLDTLPTNIQSVFTDWRQDADNRLTLEDSLDRLRLTMIAKDRP
ncbi:MAG: hypothetical protein AAGH90_03795 [Pseudomonadota bacterium]